MTTKTEAGPSFQRGTKEWLDRIVSDIFDEFFVEISAQTKLHPSEQVNRDHHLHQPSKIYDIINSYHAFCKLCEQHFYARSVANDINSFFQKHLNTAYHRQTLKVDLPPEDAPMFIWEEKFLSGICNVCDMSGLDSFIIDTKIDPLQLMKLHVCVWDKENRQTNEKFVRKLNLLKKFCGLKIFQEKYIKTVNGKAVCFLCGTKLPWPPEKAKCHLVSDGHYRNFCIFLRKYFGFAPKDALNGFNLEVVTRWLICQGPPVVEQFIDYGEREMCLQDSNSSKNPYAADKTNFSFSPKCFVKEEENDFVHKGECLICTVLVNPGHFTSELHQANAVNLDEKSFDTPEKYVIYHENRQKRLRMMENYKRLQLGLEDFHKSLPLKKTVKLQTSSPQVNYFKSYFLKKLKCVGDIFTASDEKEIFCQVCDVHVSVANTQAHLNSSCHKCEEKKWEELKENFENEKFMEPFQKIRNVIVCFLCGAELNSNSFFPHLKSSAHAQKFEWYCSLNIDVPISSVLIIRADLSCYCARCNLLLCKRVPVSSLKVSLKTIKFHWPCPRLKEKNAGLESNVINNANRKSMEENQNAVRDSDAPCSTCGKEFKEIETSSPTGSCAGDSVDFKKVEKTVESIVNVFEEKMIIKALSRSGYLISPLKNSRQIRNEEFLKAESQPTAHNESLSECAQTSKNTEPPSGAEDEIEIEENCTTSEESGQKVKNFIENELKVQRTENNIKNMEEDEEDHEVLLIEGKNKMFRPEKASEGLPSSKRKYKIILSKFQVFGKIRYILFNAGVTVLAFDQPGVAAAAAKSPNVFVKDSKLTLKVSSRKALVLAEEKLPSLNQDLVYLLQNPQKLLDFVLSLIVQAVTAAESPLERKREELVCSTIISAVLQYFPHSRCYPFGSRLSGLVSNSSDLDVFLDCGGMYEGFKNTTPSSEKKLVNRVAGLLRKKKEITDMVVVDRARVPIVSFLHKPTLMHCDLSFKNGLGIQNTLLIKFLLSLDWRVRPLVLFLKHWAKLNGLHGPPFFSSYAIAMLVIYYLQQLEQPVLPTIESLQNSYEGRRTTIAGWDCNINVNLLRLPKLENNELFPNLLVGLFEFYANFDYSVNVISPLNGKLLPREAFSATGIAKLPMCYKRHILNMPSPIENLVDSKIFICVMDPFDLSSVPTKSFTSRGLQMFISFCQTSGKYLKKALSDSKQ